MSKKVSLLTFVLCLILAVLVTFMLTFTLLSDTLREKMADAYGEPVTGDLDASSEDPEYFEKIQLIENIMEAYSYYDIEAEDFIDSLLKGMVGGIGDKYAEYYTPEEFDLLQNDTNGEMQGIGINIIYNADYQVIEVINVMPDSPALEAGILPGDLIVSVGIGENAEDVSALGYYPAVAKLQGTAGTMCEFTVARGRNYEETLDFSIERRAVTIQTVTWHVYEKNKDIGIIRIFEFDKKTPEQFKEALSELGNKGVKKFIFDLRNNPGGDLDSICEVLDVILPEGPIIKMKDKAGNESVRKSDSSELNVDMAVLCNGSTASAAELFTSAVMDYEKAVTIGTKTYGKGSVQSLLPLNDGSAIKLTTKMYFPPYSEGYDGIGITPDIEIEMDEALLDRYNNIYLIPDAEDTQLAAAITALNK